MYGTSSLKCKHFKGVVFWRGEEERVLIKKEKKEDYR